ncbi:hypothetical protein [Desulfurobacterium sp.]
MKATKRKTKWKYLLGVAIFASLLAGCGGGGGTTTASSTTTSGSTTTNGTTITDYFALPSTLYLAFTSNNTLKIVNTSNPTDVETIGAENGTTYLYHIDYTYPQGRSNYPRYVFYINNGTISRVDLTTKTISRISGLTNALYFGDNLDEFNAYQGYIEVRLSNGTTTVIPGDMPPTDLPAQYGNFSVIEFFSKLDTDGAPLGAIIEEGTTVKYCPLIATGLDLNNCTDIFTYSSYADTIAEGVNPHKVLLLKDFTDIYAFYLNNQTTVHLYSSVTDSNSTIDNSNFAYVNDHLYLLQSNSTANMIKKIDATTGSASTVFSYDNAGGLLGPSYTSFAVSPSETLGIAYPVGTVVSGVVRYYYTVKVIYSNGTSVDVESSPIWNYYIGGFYGEKMGYLMNNSTENFVKIYDTTTNTITYNATGEVVGEIKKTAGTIPDKSNIESAEAGYIVVYNGTTLQFFNATNLQIDKTISFNGTQDNWMEIDGYGNRVLGVTRLLSTNNSSEIILINIQNDTVVPVTNTSTFNEWPVY